MTIQQMVDGESLSVSIEFAALLQGSETISSITSVTVDPTGELALGTPEISGTTVVTTYDATSATVTGRRYQVTATIVNSEGETLVEHNTVALLD